MSATLTIDLPEDMRATLDKAAREDGVSENTFALQALNDYLLLRRFKKPVTDSPDKVDSLRKTMDRISRIAKRNGLTEEILDDILKES
jgi:predicted transcriptional regulator